MALVPGRQPWLLLVLLPLIMVVRLLVPFVKLMLPARSPVTAPAIVSVLIAAVSLMVASPVFLLLPPAGSCARRGLLPVVMAAISPE